MSVLFALVAFVANAGSGIYLRGEVNSWGAEAAWEFQETTESGVYVLTNKFLPAGAFKIGDAGDWTTVNFGGDDSEVALGVEYKLYENGSNVNLSAPVTCSEIRFNANNSTLLITPVNYKIDFTDERVKDIEFTRVSDSEFTLSEVELKGEFCITSLDGTVVYGSNGEDLTFSEQGYALVQDGPIFNLSSVMACSNITLNITADGATLNLGEKDVLGLYLRGEKNDWAAVDDWKFEYIGDGLYRLTDKTLSGEFKIADNSQNYDNSYGGQAGAEPWDILSGVSYLLHNKSNDYEPANLKVSSDIYCSQILFDKKTGALLINFPENVYVIGNNTGWQWTEANSMLTATENEGEYSGTINLIGAGGDPNYCYWRVYDKLENNKGYSWGFAENAESGMLVKGYEGCVMTVEGWYVVTVNLKTGEFTLEPTGDPSSVADVEAADVKVIGGAGEIRVEGAAEGVKVFALSGALLSEGETIVKVPAGIYLVSVGCKVVKVAVK